MATSVLPVVALLRISERLPVYGCPGVAMSMPRIETVIELRLLNLRQAFSVRSVRCELRTKQKMVTLLKLGSLKLEAFHEKKLCEQQVFAPPMGQQAVKNVLGVDIPLIMPIPHDVALLGLFSNWNSLTIHTLHVEYTVGSRTDTEHQTYVKDFPLVIKRYDNLPIYRQFQEPKTHRRVLGNKQIVINVTLPDALCVGPMDTFSVHVNLKANNLHSHLRRDVRLKQLTIQLREVCTCHEAGLTPRREIKLSTTNKQFNDSDNVLNTVGLSHTFNLKFSRVNDYLSIYDTLEPPIPPLEVKDTDALALMVDNSSLARERVLDRPDDGVPLTHAFGFTTSEGKLFRISYEMNIKLKLSGAKDLEERFPLTVLAYDRASSEALLPWIMHECEVAKARFGKEVVQAAATGSSKLLEFTAPPVVYYNNINDWLKMGYPRQAYLSDTAVLLDIPHM